MEAILSRETGFKYFVLAEREEIKGESSIMSHFWRKGAIERRD
jgi:hypothetical protein